MNWRSFITGTIIVVAIGYYFLQSEPLNVTKYMNDDRWWTNEQPHLTENDTTIKPFKVNVSKHVLIDLNMRLKAVRKYKTLRGTKWDYGANSDYILTLIHYWQDHYNWTKHERIINNFNHYKTKIQGLDIHFIYQTTKQNTTYNVNKVVLMIHGWPGSFYEFYKVIPLLATKGYAVIVPSLPGFGYSDHPQMSGLGTVETAVIFIQLMHRLGYKHYYVQGGDWGAAIANTMAILDSKHCKGIHLNFVFMTAPNPVLTYGVGSIFPSLVIPDREERERLYPFLQRFIEYALEMSHFFLHSSKPDTLGLALNDSPIGLTAYIIEKFVRWSGCSNNSKFDSIEEKFTKDELITNVLIYWVTQTIVPSLRYYKESIFNVKTFEIDRIPVLIPVGIADFPKEVFRPPRSWLTHRYKKIITYNTLANGGHFAALEQPQLLAADLMNFMTKTEVLYSQGKIESTSS